MRSCSSAWVFKLSAGQWRNRLLVNCVCMCKDQPYPDWCHKIKTLQDCLYGQTTSNQTRSERHKSRMKELMDERFSKMEDKFEDNIENLLKGKK